MSHPVVFLWAHPRSLSTAFLRMVLERGDFLVVHEPLSSIVVQGYAMIGDDKVATSSELVDLLEERSARTAIFVKETTEYRYDVLNDARLPRLAAHTFIIREPTRTIASHYAMNPRVARDEIGYEHQLEILELMRAQSRNPLLVIEAERLIADPETTVGDYCRRIGVPFRADALTWQPDEREEWSRTKAWHVDVARSTGFRPRGKSYRTTVQNHPLLAEYHRYHAPFYEQLRAHAS
jgi:hypothetical protein